MCPGVKTQKILSANTKRVESFGAGQDYSKAFWQQFLRQLLSAGYLTVNIERYGRVEITATGFSLLRGETTFEYQAMREAITSKTPTKTGLRVAIQAYRRQTTSNLAG
ncbi:MAG: hypothetical protein CM1200mP41_27620 [Gammaproteobacteria bacterium]|nr:MAG: hypothetical protein CM1200mP41_27620 [Gammaproteobacteria bacterium]